MSLPFLRRGGDLSIRFTGHGHIFFSADLITSGAHHLVSTGEAEEDPLSGMGFVVWVVESPVIWTIIVTPCTSKSVSPKFVSTVEQCIYTVSLAKKQVWARGLDTQLGIKESMKIPLDEIEYDFSRLDSSGIFVNQNRKSFIAILKKTVDGPKLHP